MSIEKVRTFFAGTEKETLILEFPVSSATVPLAAKALGTEEARIAKTLAFQHKDGGCLLLVTAGDAKISNRKFKDRFGFKAKLMSYEDTAAATGHAVGGVCPFALPETGVTVYCDSSLRRFDVVYPAAGSSNSAVPMTCPELFRYSRAQDWVDVCDLPQAGSAVADA